MRADLHTALAEGRGVTAKIRWLARPDPDGAGEGRSRWIHCTPLLGHSGAVGVWMVVLVDEERSSSNRSERGGGGAQSINGAAGSVNGGSAKNGDFGAAAGGGRFRRAPPVANIIGGKEWNGVAAARGLINGTVGSDTTAAHRRLSSGAAVVAAATQHHHYQVPGSGKRAPESRSASRAEGSRGLAPGSSVAGGSVVSNGITTSIVGGAGVGDDAGSARGETLLHEDALDLPTPTPSQAANSEFSFQLK